MGKVEKVIVLSVLFLIALILVVSVTVDDPLDKSRVVEAGAKPPPAVAQAPGAAGAQKPPVLSSTVQPPVELLAAPPPAPAEPGRATITPPPVSVPPAPQSGAAGLPPGALLVKTDGLEASYFPDLMLYTWQPGDNWRKVANDYYGDWKRLDLLKRHNEGRMDVQPGERVFVPVFADGAAAPGATTTAPPVAGSGPAAGLAAGSSAAPAAVASAASAKAATGKKVHVVQSGESLWKIAKAELGDGNRWKEIYDANRDVLKDRPEAVKKGMRLRIP